VINDYRAQVGAAALSYADDQQACADKEAFDDFRQNRAHATFGSCQEGGQCECPGWPACSTDQLSNCLKMMFNEGPPSPGGTNHYSIMTNRGYAKVVCGFYDGGEGHAWMVQSYY
jgi:hypothetical protein